MYCGARCGRWRRFLAAALYALRVIAHPGERRVSLRETDELRNGQCVERRQRKSTPVCTIKCVWEGLRRLGGSFAFDHRERARVLPRLSHPVKPMQAASGYPGDHLTGTALTSPRGRCRRHSPARLATSSLRNARLDIGCTNDSTASSANVTVVRTAVVKRCVADSTGSSPWPLRDGACSETRRWNPRRERDARLLELPWYSPPAGRVCLHAPCASEMCRCLKLTWGSPPSCVLSH